MNIKDKIFNLLNEALTTSQQHQKKIALSTLKMSDIGASIMGGMTKADARKFLKSIGYSDMQIKKLEESDMQEAIDIKKAKENVLQMATIELSKKLTGSEKQNFDELNKAKDISAEARREFNTMIEKLKSKFFGDTSKINSIPELMKLIKDKGAIETFKKMS